MAERPQPDREYYDCDFVVRHRMAALAFGADIWMSVTRADLDRTVPVSRLESPLEMAFLCWWKVLSEVYGFQDVWLVSQQGWPVGDKLYRVDFAIHWTNEEWRAAAHRAGIPVPIMVIELDGHDFHERTKEQVAYRNERDRALQAAGLRVLHYSGSEFNANPEKCVHGAYLEARGVFGDVLLRTWAIDRLRDQATTNSGQVDPPT